jgi:hypothetical protein
MSERVESLRKNYRRTDYGQVRRPGSMRAKTHDINHYEMKSRDTGQQLRQLLQFAWTKTGPAGSEGKERIGRE